jgi:multiple sugar transport system permease protein
MQNSKASKMSPKERRNLLLGVLFISPWLIGFLLFSAYPIGSSFYYSFHRYDLIREPVFIGLKNYNEIFNYDPRFKQVMSNTFFYVFLGVPLQLVSAYLMSILLNSKIVGRSIFRAIFFFPSIIPAVVTAMVWQFLLNVQYGLINSFLRTWELPIIPFLTSTALSKPTLILVNMWAQGTTIVIFLAALQDVPKPLYDAATVDGANSWQKFWYITVPMTSPVIMFNLVMGLVWSFQDFTMPWLLTGGGPAQSSELIAMLLYRHAFEFLHMGKASALAWIMLVIIMTFTIVLFKTSKFWVFYANAESEDSL